MVLSKTVNDYRTYKGNKYKIVKDLWYYFNLHFQNNSESDPLFIELEKPADFKGYHLFIDAVVWKPKQTATVFNLTYFRLSKRKIIENSKNFHLTNDLSESGYSIGADLWMQYFVDVNDNNNIYTMDYRGDSLLHVQPDENIYYSYESSNTAYFQLFIHAIWGELIE